MTTTIHVTLRRIEGGGGGGGDDKHRLITGRQTSFSYIIRFVFVKVVVTYS